MDLFNQELMYELHVKDLLHVDALKQYADHMVKEIKSTVGWDTDVQINIEPEAKDKHLFMVSMSVFGLGKPIVVRKDGKHPLSILRKVRKSVLRQIHQLNEKRISRRKQREQKKIFRDNDLVAS